MLLAVLELALFYLDDEVGNGRTVSIHHNNIGTLGAIPSKCDRIFHREASLGVAVVVQQPVEPELADDFLGLGDDVFVAHLATQAGFFAFDRQGGLNGGFAENILRLTGKRFSEQV